MSATFSHWWFKQKYSLTYPLLNNFLICFTTQVFLLPSSGSSLTVFSENRAPVVCPARRLSNCWSLWSQSCILLCKRTEIFAIVPLVETHCVCLPSFYVTQKTPHVGQKTRSSWLCCRPVSQHTMHNECSPSVQSSFSLVESSLTNSSSSLKSTFFTTVEVASKMWECCQCYSLQNQKQPCTYL